MRKPDVTSLVAGLALTAFGTLLLLDRLGELEERAGGTRVQACRLGVVDHRGQGAVEVETDHHTGEDVAYGVVVGARVVGGELHGTSQPRGGGDPRTVPPQRTTGGRRW